MLPATSTLRGKVPALTVVSRGLQLRRLVIDLASIKGEEELFIPSFLEEALGGDGNLQIKMARTMQAQEKRDRKCFICQSTDHLMRDHYQRKNGMGPLQPEGPPQNKSACEMAKVSPPGQATSHGAPPK